MTRGEHARIKWLPLVACFALVIAAIGIVALAQRGGGNAGGLDTQLLRQRLRLEGCLRGAFEDAYVRVSSNGEDPLAAFASAVGTECQELAATLDVQVLVNPTRADWLGVGNGGSAVLVVAIPTQRSREMGLGGRRAVVVSADGAVGAREVGDTTMLKRVVWDDQER